MQRCKEGEMRPVGSGEKWHSRFRLFGEWIQKLAGLKKAVKKQMKRFLPKTVRYYHFTKKLE
jgi:hypothetical protein